MPTKIQFRRGTSIQWTEANPILLNGELGFETDTKKFKIGDGSTYWNNLLYTSLSESHAQSLVDAHADRTDNPHAVTKDQVGLGNVDNTSDINKPISTATQAALNLKYDASNPSSYVNASQAAAAAPVQSVSGKTGIVTLEKADVGLSNVDNTSDASKPISTATQIALNLKYDASNPDNYVNASQASAAAPVQSVAGKTGIVTLTKTDVGLANVPNVDATQRSNHSGTQTSSTISDFSTAVDARIDLQKGVGLGLATLDSGGKVPATQLPSTLMEFKGTWNASTNTPTLANGSPANLPEDAGHVYVCSVDGTVNFGAGPITFTAGDWVVLADSLIWEKSVNSNLVSSVNGYQGIVVLSKTDIGLGNVDNTSDANKPISTATQSALNLKYDASNPSGYVNASQASAAAPVQSVAGRIGNVVLTKSDVGLGNVDNTSDANKPISTATQSALNLKYDASNPAGYVNTAEASAAAPVQSVAGRTGAVTLTKSDVGLENVPNVDATSRANHTGTQLASTISDFTTAVQAVTIDAARIDGGVVSNAEFATLDGITTGVSIQSQINGKEPSITAGTTAQYWRGDKSFQTLDAAVVANTPTGNIIATTVQAALNELDAEKQAVIIGAATTITASNLTASRALSSDASGKVAVSVTTSTELGYVSGVTSAIQTQIDGKRGFLGIQTLTTGTTYTPTAGAAYIEAILVGGGGGGGGVSGANASIGAGGGGGSGAVLTVAVALTGAATYTYAIGTAGTAGTGATNPTAGGVGGSTTLTIGATTYTAAGGSGGAAQTAGTAVALVLGGAGGALPTGGSINVPGIAGSNGFRSSGTVGFSGAGASSPYGAGGSVPTAAAAGNSGAGYGSGGSGGYSTANANRAGGAGSAGVIIIREYK